MKLEIEFESFEDLDRKLSSALRRSEILNLKVVILLKILKNVLNFMTMNMKIIILI